MDKGQIDQLLNYIKDAVEFGKDQMPDVARQIVFFGIISSAMWILLLASLLAIAWFRVRPWLIERFERDDDDFTALLTSIFTVFGSVVATVLIVVSIQFLLMAIFAPKIYIIKSLSRLM